MQANIKRITYAEACEISKWIYKNKYSNFSMDGSSKCIKELRIGPYYSVTHKNNNLLGYYCFDKAARVLIDRQLELYNDKSFTDIGLGLRPDLCGKGLGFNFLKMGINFARDQLSAEKFRLTVASFNTPAIKVYSKLGFEKVNSFKKTSTLGKVEFWIMVLRDTGM